MACDRMQSARYILGLSCSAKTLCIFCPKNSLFNGMQVLAKVREKVIMVTSLRCPQKWSKWTGKHQFPKTDLPSPPKKKKHISKMQTAQICKSLNCWKMIVYPCLSSPFIFVLHPRISHNNKAAKASEDTRFLWRWLLPIPQAPVRPKGALGPCHRSGCRLVVLSGLVCGFFSKKKPKVENPFFGKVTFHNFQMRVSQNLLVCFTCGFEKHHLKNMILGYSRLNFCEWRWKASGQNRRFASHELEGVRPLQQWHLPASCINGKQYPNNTCLKPKHLKQSESPCRLNKHIFFYTKSGGY